MGWVIGGGVGSATFVVSLLSMVLYNRIMVCGRVVIGFSLIWFDMLLLQFHYTYLDIVRVCILVAPTRGIYRGISP